MSDGGEQPVPEEGNKENNPEDQGVLVNGYGDDNPQEVEKKLGEITDAMRDLTLSSSPEPIEPSEEPKPPNHRLKWIEFNGNNLPIITQNENGPCPLIAISNILLLTGRVVLTQKSDVITSTHLLEYIADQIVTSMPEAKAADVKQDVVPELLKGLREEYLDFSSCCLKNLPEGRQLNLEQNISDALSVLPKLHTGLDVNVKFTGCTKFEFTPECVVFDLLDIPLLHGWVVDPQYKEEAHAIGTLSYNQVVEKIINGKTSEDSELLSEALMAEQFLQRTATQLTYHGLTLLHSTMKNNQLAVLFRNNHFSTILKKRDELFQLVTDQGLLLEKRFVWETINNIEGDGVFVDANFHTAPLKSASGEIRRPRENDYLVALSLEEEQKKLEENDRAWEEVTSEEDLSRHLEEEERRQQTHSPQSHGSTRPFAQATSSGERSKKGSCAIL